MCFKFQKYLAKKQKLLNYNDPDMVEILSRKIFMENKTFYNIFGKILPA